jgi:hypothetical protein
LEGGDRQERTPALSGAHQPFASNLLGLAFGRSEDSVEVERCEPEIDFVTLGTEIHAARAVIAGEVNIFPNPIQVDGGVDAVILKEWHCDAWNRRGLHIRKRAFEDADARNSDNRFDFPRLDQRHDNRAAFGHKDGVPEALSLELQVLD